MAIQINAVATDKVLAAKAFLKTKSIPDAVVKTIGDASTAALMAMAKDMGFTLAQTTNPGCSVFTTRYAPKNGVNAGKEATYLVIGKPGARVGETWGSLYMARFETDAEKQAVEAELTHLSDALNDALGRS